MTFILLSYTSQRFLLHQLSRADITTITKVLAGFSLKVSFPDLFLKLPSSLGIISCLLGSTNYQLIVLLFPYSALGYKFLSSLIQLHSGRGGFSGHSLRFALTAGVLFLAVSPWFFLMIQLVYHTACCSSLRGVTIFESTLRLELAHALFQMNSVPLGGASELSFLTVCPSWADSPSHCSGRRAEQQPLASYTVVKLLFSSWRLGGGRQPLLSWPSSPGMQPLLLGVGGYEKSRWPTFFVTYGVNLD